MNVEEDVRYRYNRRVLLCIRIKGAALLIGLWDLFFHFVALCALIFMFGGASETATGLASANNDMYRRTPKVFDEHYHDSPSSFVANMDDFSSNHRLLDRILEQNNASQQLMELNAKNFYSHWNIMTTNWMHSLTQQDKFIVFCIILSATVLILAHIYGVLTNKPSYIVPYFLIKVFNVIIAILTMLGFYAYLPDIRIWLRMRPQFPYKDYLLQLDSQTLQLVTFTCLLFLTLFKVYIAAVIWYCYSYITALTVARNIGTITTHSRGSEAIIGEMYSPPKYEEAIRLNPQDQEDYAPPPYTPLLSS